MMRVDLAPVVEQLKRIADLLEEHGRGTTRTFRSGYTSDDTAGAGVFYEAREEAGQEEGEDGSEGTPGQPRRAFYRF